jgi:Protein of unknown function (DUF3060)
VSGTGHTITVDSAGTINISGVSNAITYHSGTPAVGSSAIQNLVYRDESPCAPTYFMAAAQT